ncbi:MAG: hypothetical protein Q8S73_33625 [Deltaproteobacteria bacterium]|nr:hypothetical protein [Deltaproteobacteria bacterium]
MKRWGFVGLVLALATACTFSPENPSVVFGRDAAACGDCARDVAPCVGDACGVCSGPDRALCNGACVLLTSTQNCGACGVVCATSMGESCVRSSAGDAGVGARVAQCRFGCPPGQTPCGAFCRDLTNDPNHCRSCGNQCAFPGAVAGCTGSICVLLSCREGFGNCDGDAANGCEVATSADPMNCGVCGNRCGFANAAATCAAGRCVLGACNAGFADCDGDPVNGCEVNTTMGDLANCGRCGGRCPAPPVGATAVCNGGVCGVSALMCPSDRLDCNGLAADGCERLGLTDVSHCGACGNRCPTTGGTATCVGGVCALACAAGLGNCDGDASNGCETSTRTTVAHCGGCDRPCSLPNATAGCAAGACTIASCNAGFANCDGNAANGCEANTTTNNAHCGACGRLCPGAQACVAGACVTVCPAGQTSCSGTCRDLAADNTNCGACGTVCTGGASCQARSCRCPSGQTSCAGTCRALQTDNANCGTCGTVCGAGTVCSGGMCTASCASPTTNCSGVCRDLQNDANHCSACGAVCSRANAVAGCASGACTLAACNAGFGNCDGNAANGCEVNTSTSVTNCGVCGNSCQFANAAASCVAGRCTRGACGAGFANCDGVDANGCEVNTVAGDINHCGGCNNRCPTPPIGSIAVCASSMCTTSSVSCMAGTADCDGAPANGCEVAITTVTNCGACGRACVGTNGTATCVSQLCGINCSAGFGNCNGLLSDGCEVNTNTSPTNCGGCNTVCSLPNATAGCAAGACTIASCNAGFANCDGMAANGCEVNLNSDTANCGACSTVVAPRACGAGQLCSAGTCVTTCGSGQTNCSGVCRNLPADSDACGACGTVCSGTGLVSRTCGGSVCNGTCSAGRANCDGNLQGNGCEVDINTSVAQCGGCTGMACSSSNIAAACVGGTCTGACTVGFADCDGDKRTNGCEVNTTNNASHCGVCGNVCPTRPNTTPRCVSGACGFTCIAGFDDCNSDPADGCEEDLRFDGNCGACGEFCDPGMLCRPRLGMPALYICR